MKECTKLLRRSDELAVGKGVGFIYIPVTMIFPILGLVQISKHRGVLIGTFEIDLLRGGWFPNTVKGGSRWIHPGMLEMAGNCAMTYN